jgi:hypothetical protein
VELPVLKKDYQIALVSSGISHVQRGFETFIADLALALDSYPNVHLFQGSGPARSQKATILPTLRRNSWAMQWLGPKLEHRRYRLEQLSFVFAGWILGYWPGALVAPQLTVVTSTIAQSDVAVPVKHARPASVGPSAAVAHETLTVLGRSSNGR